MKKKLVGTVVELKKKKQFSRWINDHDILVYLHKDSVKAISNICPHFGGPIGYHEIKEVNGKEVFTCLWHNLQFNVEDGVCTLHKNLKLREYKVVVVSDNIFVYIN